MARTNWQHDEIVTEGDLNQIGAEINQNADEVSSLAGVGRTTETVKGNADALAAHFADYTNLQNKMSSLEQYKATSSLELLDLKMQLEEANLVDFVNKTGIGFYDLFDTTDYVDMANTTAEVDTTNKVVNFPARQDYTVRSIGAFNALNTITVDAMVSQGDRLNNLLVNSVANRSASVNHEVVDATVASSAFDTSGNGGRKLVKLDNGWLVSIVMEMTSTEVYHLKVLKSVETGWEEFAKITDTNFNYNTSCIVSNGNFIYLIVGTNSAGILYSWSYNMTTWVSGITALTVSNLTVVDTGQVFVGNASSSGGTSLTIDYLNRELYVCWSSKNSAYSNSFNIRYAKGVINADGSVTWGVAVQLTTYNATTNNFIDPYIVFANGSVHIFCQCVDSTVYRIIEFTNAYTTKHVGYSGISTFGDNVVYNGSTYVQSSPSAIFVPQAINGLVNGRIWVAWIGTDSIDTTANNLRVSYSDDGGVTWSAMQKLTSGNATQNYQGTPSIVANKNNEIFIVLSGRDGVTTYMQLRKIRYSNGVWGSIQTLTSFTSNTANLNVSALFDLTFTLDFTEPLFIYQDSQNSKVGFYGTWIVGGTIYDVTLESPITTTDQEVLNVVPYPFTELKMLPQTFDQFSNMELRLYATPKYVNVKGDVSNSPTITTGATDKVVKIGDKLWTGSENEVIDLVGNFTNYDVQDATVVASAYDTSGNGGRKSVRLSNGWIVASAKSTVGPMFYLFVSKDDGQTWSQLCYRDLSGGGYQAVDSALCSNGTTIYLAMTHGRGEVWKIDAITQTNSDISNDYETKRILDEMNGPFGNCSIICSNNEIHYAYARKNPSYPNSFNIQYVKGTINGDGSVTWGSVEQVTKLSNASYPSFAINPCIFVIDNIPCIMFEQQAWGLDGTGGYAGNQITFARRDSSLTTGNPYLDTNWSFKVIYRNATNYIQSNPSAIYVPQSINGLVNGRIWVAWLGKDATLTLSNNVRVSHSDDGGITWNIPEIITNLNSSGNHAESASITANKDNKIFIVYSYNDLYMDIYRSEYTTAWSDKILVKSSNTFHLRYPSTLFDPTFTLDFSEPLFIYQDNENSKVGFYGTWTIGEGYTLTMQNPVTLTDGQKIPIIDYGVKQSNTDMMLKSIDEEKYNFGITGLSATSADIEVMGKDTILNAIAYAIS